MSARRTLRVELPDLHSLRQGAAPMEARSAESLPNEPGEWQFEPKWDGFRCLAFKEGGAVELKGKSGTSLSRFFPEVVATLQDAPFERFVVDGELVVELNGRITFDALQARLHPAASRIRRLSHGNAGAAYPLRHAGRARWLAGRGASSRAATERARGLRREGGDCGKAHRHALHARSHRRRQQWLDDFDRDGRDGVVAKRLRANIMSGERAMIKVKRLRTADCVVGGFRYLSGRPEVGSLLLGLYNPQGLLDHVGFTSTIANDERPELTRKLRALQAPPGFTGQGAGRVQPLEHGAQRRMGAAAAGAGRRSAIRSRDARPVPPRDEAAPLQARQAGATVHDRSDHCAAPGSIRG